MTGNEQVLSIQSRTANAFVIVIDGHVVGAVDDHSHGGKDLTLSVNVTIPSSASGSHSLVLLSESLGFSNGMAAGSTRKTKGIIGSVHLGSIDLTHGEWTMRPKLAGENLEVYTAAGGKEVIWKSSWRSVSGESLVWYRASFATPVGDAPLVLNMTGLGRGHFYLNGNDLGRYWTLLKNDGSQRPTQALYTVPVSWLSPVGATNLLVVGEILGATDVSRVQLLASKMVSGAPPMPLPSYHGIQTCPY